MRLCVRPSVRLSLSLALSFFALASAAATAATSALVALSASYCCHRLAFRAAEAEAELAPTAAAVAGAEAKAAPTAAAAAAAVAAAAGSGECGQQRAAAMKLACQPMPKPSSQPAGLRKPRVAHRQGPDRYLDSRVLATVFANEPAASHWTSADRMRCGALLAWGARCFYHQRQTTASHAHSLASIRSSIISISDAQRSSASE